MNTFKGEILFFLSSLAFCASLFAQKEANIWYFGDGAGLDFNATPAQMLTNGSINTDEGSASIADSNGSLLFYTDGVTVWNKNHDTLKYGFGLNGHSTSAQSALIVRQPNSSNQYYIFSTAVESYYKLKYWLPDLATGVYYSIVDLGKENGLGEIVVKNVPLMDSSTESISAIYHKNKIDIWIVTVQAETNRIYIYLLTRNGIQLHSSDQYQLDSQRRRSQLKFSPDSKNLVITNDNIKNPKIYLFDFDNSTGKLSNQRFIANVRSYSMEFSNNSELLYFTDIKGKYFALYQCKTSDIGNDSLQGTNYTKLFEEINTSFGFGSLQRGPNNIIYLNGTGTHQYLSEIKNPDKIGLSCGFQYRSMKFPSEIVHFGLPNAVQTNLYRPYLEFSNSCIGDSVYFKINRWSADSVIWDFGDGNNQTVKSDSVFYSYISSGRFEIKATLFYPNAIETLSDTIRIYELPNPNLGNDTLLCNGESLTLRLDTAEKNKIIWRNGDNAFTKTISSQELVWVAISNDYCKTADTILIDFINCELRVDSLCLGASTVFTLDETAFDSVIWNFGDLSTLTSTKNQINHQYFNASGYSVSAKIFRQNLSRKIGKNFQVIKVPEDYLPEDTALCGQITLSPDITSSGLLFSWNTGSNGEAITVDKTGTYILSIQKGNCVSHDTVNVELENCECYFFMPDAFSPNGDNLNDTFRPFTDCEIASIHFDIYNRWGEKIFVSKEDITQWDGTYLDRIAPNGIYFYLISVQLNNNERLYKSGTVKVFR
jgi:gliding motility-associated-like protein